jgi:inward rectifier potassium channel
LKNKKIKSLPVKKKGNKFVEIGEISFDWDDIYHFLLTITWWQFITLITSFYFIINFVFACAYLLQDNAINNARSGYLIDAFAFSVQTMATIGYGAMYPQTAYAHLLVSIEVLCDLKKILARFWKKKLDNSKAEMLINSC